MDFVEYGKALNDHLTKLATDAGCEYVTLDSGTRREGYTITSFHFGRSLRRR